MYVVLRKIRRVEPPLLPKNRKRLCFLDAWLGAALRRILGRLFPTKGVFCLVPRVQWDMEEAMGSSALLESISRLIPLNTIGSPRSLAVCRPQSSLKGSPFHTAACLPGVLLPAALCLFFAEPSAASSCFQMFPSGSHPAWLLSSEYQGQNTHIGASGLPRDLHGGQNSTFVPSCKAPFSSVRKERHGLVRAQLLLYNLFPDAINNPDESHFKGKGWRQRGGLGTKQDGASHCPIPPQRFA